MKFNTALFFVAAAFFAVPASSTPLGGSDFIASFCTDVLPVLEGNAQDMLAASNLTGLDDATQSVLNATTQIFAIGEISDLHSHTLSFTLSNLRSFSGTSPEIQQQCATGTASQGGKRVLGVNATSMKEEKTTTIDDDKQKKTGVLAKVEAGASGLVDKLEGLFCKMKGSFCTDPPTINGEVQPANFKPSITTLVTVGLASLNKTAPSAHVLTLVGDVVCGLVPALTKCDAAKK